MSDRYRRLLWLTEDLVGLARWPAAPVDVDGVVRARRRARRRLVDGGPGVTIYSERFMIVTGASVGASAVVGAEKRWVLRDLLISWTASGAAVSLAIGGRYVLVTNFPAAQGSQALDIRVVAYQGEVVGLTTFGAATYACLSGYEFNDPRGRAGPPADVDYRRVDALQPLPAA